MEIGRKVVQEKVILTMLAAVIGRKQQDTWLRPKLTVLQKIVEEEQLVQFRRRTVIFTM